MYMSVIQSVRICRKRKSGFLGRNCDVWGFFGVIILKKIIFIKGLFYPPNSLPVAAEFKGKCFSGCESLFQRVWLWLNRGEIPNFQPLLPFFLPSHEIFRDLKGRGKGSISASHSQISLLDRRETPSYAGGKSGTNPSMSALSHPYKGIRLSSSPAPSLPLLLPLDVPLECRGSRNFKSQFLLNQVYRAQRLRTAPVSSKPRITPSRFQLQPKFYLGMETFIIFFSRCFQPLFQPCLPVDALINYSSNLNERFNSTVAS